MTDAEQQAKTPMQGLQREQCYLIMMRPAENPPEPPKPQADMRAEHHEFLVDMERRGILVGAGSSRRNLDAALAFAETGRLTCAIDEILPLARLHEAFDRIAAGTVTGKLVIDPSRQD